MPEATVHEALQFSARLRLPASVPAATVEAFVEEARRGALPGEGGDKLLWGCRAASQ